MSGKWHLSKQPTDFGFQRYWGHLSGACNFFTGDNSFRLNGKEWGIPKNLNGKPFYTTHAITDFALDFIEEGEVGETSDPFSSTSPTMLPITRCMLRNPRLKNTTGCMTVDGTN